MKDKRHIALLALAIVASAWMSYPRVSRIIEDTYFPIVYNADFEQGWDGWELRYLPSDIYTEEEKEEYAPEITQSQGACFWLKHSASLYQHIKVKPGVPNEIMFNLRATHGATRRTLSIAFIGDDGQRINGSILTPYTFNEYHNDGFGINSFVFIPTAKQGLLAFGSDCIEGKIVFPMGRLIQ